MKEKKNDQNENNYYSKDLTEKLLIMRHGQTPFNEDKDSISRRTNPRYSDCQLTEKGISQAKSKQGILNSLNLEKVYVSPLYRALQTITYSLENHPNKKNITVIVHPLLSEITNCINDYILDINQTKKDFNMDSKIKVDWSVYDEYIKGINYDENFYYFDNFDCLKEEEKKKMYLSLKNYYDKRDIDGLRGELSNLATLISQQNVRVESLKHLQGRFKKFCDYIREKHKDTLEDKTKKIFAVSHWSYMKIGTDMSPYSSNSIQDYHPNCYGPSNCEILSYKL